MTSISMTSIPDADYCAIEDALQSTEKGRRFLRAYVDRNRSLESRRLLRSIARLHRAALGTPGQNAEVCRDLVSVLKYVAKHRRTAAGYVDPAARSGVLTCALEETEACLIALVESLEERAFETLGEGVSISRFEMADETYSVARAARLFGELSSFFSNDPR
ncbi:MAG: hypothetical protein ACLPPF_16065 [Rhodomicrobium sp.]